MNHLRFLRYIDEIARSGSIRAAAERLHVAPSAVNRRLQDIEEELDAPLFERLPRGMRLTAAGEMFITYVRARQAELDQVRSNIEELKGLRRGTVKLICSQGLAPSFVPQAISSFRRQHPLVEFRVQVGDHVQALSALRAMETDLILVFNLDTEQALDLGQRRVAAHQQLARLVGENAALGLAVFVLNITDQCFEHVLHGQVANHLAVGLLDQGEVRAALTELLEQLRQRHVPADALQRVHQIRQLER
jgi:DNA-binding transcriptional LysR family regulator